MHECWNCAYLDHIINFGSRHFISPELACSNKRSSEELIICHVLIIHNFFQWLATKKNLRSLQFNHIRNIIHPNMYVSGSYITSEMMKCATYIHSRNIKSLSLNMASDIPLLEDIKHISALEHLEDLEINFSSESDVVLDVDDVLIVISAGCKNLKKFTFKCE